MGDEVELDPIRADAADIDAIEKRIKKLFREEIYLPLIRELGLPKQALHNSREDFVQAIISGKIYFDRGIFKGRFSASISKELRNIRAVWNAQQKGYKISFSRLPQEIKTAIGVSEDRFKKVVRRIDQRLGEMLPENISDQLKTENIFDTSLWKLNRKLEGTLKGITVAPELTDAQRIIIAEEYTNDLKRFIKDWSEKEIVRLRKRIQEKGLSGFRYEGMVDEIQKSYQVGLNKAKFLARQETNLMLTKFKEARYEEAGVNQYIWHTVAGTPAHPVRDSHKKLAGKKFSWNDPPITTRPGEPVRRNNPGQDFNCRCFARPVVKFK